jgi:anaerobic ribonucleoside-triphosphate reductase activating protein
MSTAIAISRLHFPVTKLGPGRRVGIWLQGCSIRCPGCISMDTWAPNRGLTSVGEVLGAVAPWIPSAEGFTVSGGEPFDQASALRVLLEGLRAASFADILVFTGYAFERIAEDLLMMEGLIDALITDPFDRAAPQTQALRGSDNQRLHLLTEVGRLRFASYERLADGRDRSVDVMFDDDGTVWLAGIPGRDDLRRLQRILEADGGRLSTSEDRHAASTSASVLPR